MTTDISPLQTPRMKPEIKALWTEALRSGRYTQGRKALRIQKDDEPAQYCCLGVLCDLYAQQTGNAKWEPPVPAEDDFVEDPEGTTLFVVPGRSTSTMLLPPDVVDWSGLMTACPQAEYNLSLTTLNDNGTPFAAIAEVIEQHL